MSKQIIDEDKTPRPLERADRSRESTKSGAARRQRQARNGGANRHNVRPVLANTRKGKMSASIFSVARLGQAGVDKDGNAVLVERPRGSQRDYSLDGLKVGQLRDLASRRGLKGLYTAKKAALIAAIKEDRF